MLLVHEQTFLCTAVGTCRRTVIVSITISHKHSADRMQSLLDRDKPQRLFKRKCTDFIGVEEFHVEFVIFNKRSSFFIEGPASWHDRQTVQVSVCFQNYSLLSTISGVIFIFFFFILLLFLSFFCGMPCVFFFSARTIWAFFPFLHFFFFMKSCNYRHSLIVDSMQDRCQQLSVLAHF